MKNVAKTILHIGIGKWIKNVQFVQWLENMDTLRLIVVILIHWFYDTYLFIYQTITNTYYQKHFHYYTNIVFSNLWFQVFIILISKRGFLSPHDKVMFHLRSVLKKKGDTLAISSFSWLKMYWQDSEYLCLINKIQPFGKYGWLPYTVNIINTRVNHSSSAVCSLFKAHLIHSMLKIAAITILLAQPLTALLSSSHGGWRRRTVEKLPKCI